MRIAIATGPFIPPPPGPAGAVERLTADLARRFASRGHEVTLLSRRHARAPNLETLDGVRHVRLRGSRSTHSVYLNILKDLPYSLAAARALPEADIWVLNAFWLPLFAVRRRRPGGARIVVAAHRYPKGQYRLYRGVDRITAVSQAVARAIAAQAPWSKGLVNVIPNPIDTDAFTPVQRDFGASPRFLYAGRIHPEKGLELLIAAFARIAPELPGSTLTLMGAWRSEQGGGGSAYLERLRVLAGSAPVSFRDPVFERRSFALALQSSDIFVYPSIAEQGEAFGVAPLEAMATGAVAVVSALDCFNDFVTDRETGRVFNHRSPNAVVELAALLSSLAADPVALRRLSAAGAAKATAFDYERISEYHLADYATLLTP